MKTIKSVQKTLGAMRLLRVPLTSQVRFYQSILAAILVAGATAQSRAQIYSLTSQNSSLQVDVSGGLTPWTIDGVNQLNQQWFYYSIGSGPVYSIDTIAPWTVPTITGGTVPTLTETYANSLISVKTKYTLQGQLAGSGKATLGQTITLNNPSATAQTYHFYQYSDFNMAGTSGSQYLQFNVNGATTAYQVVQSGGATLTGTVTALSGGASIAPEEQAGLYDGSMFGLVNGNPAPTLNNNLNAGPGNVVYAYEWDVTLAAYGNPGSSLTLSEIQAVVPVVPEPSSVALIAAGLLGLAFFRKCRQMRQSI